jgi:ATP-binding cassette subfamily B (MDR/TAP) protein 1
MEHVEQAAKTANAHEFIKELPNGYHTQVGERGSRLSGGQRQRIAIARAIVSNPEILLLDEATAALDTRTERLVRDALYSAAKDRTTVIIAHRLSTVQKADRIVVIEHGRVIEQGTHSELITADSTYASLVRAQQLQRHEDDGESEVASIKQETTTSNSRDSINGLQNAEDAQRQILGNSFIELAKLVWDLNKQERSHLFIGAIAGMVAGAGFPILGIFFGNGIISFTDESLSEGGHSQSFWSLMLLMLGLVLFLAYSIQGFCFAVSGAALGQRARSRVFASIMDQDMAFFDHKENSSGSLTAYLSTEATKLTGISGNNLSAILNAIVTLVSAIAVGCSFGWKLGLVATATTPISITCGFMRHRIVSKTEQRVKATTGAVVLASEAVTAIRTVALMTMETTINRQYAASIQSEYGKSLLLDFGSALTYAITQSMPVLVNGLLFWYGGTHLIGTGEYTVKQFFICYMAVVFGAQATGSVFSYAGEIEGAKNAAAKLKYLIESKPSIDADASAGEKHHEVFGDIDVQNVNFAYPSAPHHSVLNDISLAARQGQYIALVGGSGSGKSTVLNLIERFYDPTAGSVLADKRDIRTLHLKWLRSQMALVEQEAPLIGGTIRECLISDNENLDISALEEACKAANIFDFVVSGCDWLSFSADMSLIILFRYLFLKVSTLTPDHEVIGCREAKGSG